MDTSSLPARLSLTHDLVFKALFVSNEEILIDLLTAVLRPAVRIERALVRNPELSRSFPDEKGGFLDISIRLADGTLLDVEMQKARRGAFLPRALYYWARLFSSQLAPGELHERLAPTKSILFLDYVEFSFPNFHEIFRLVGRYAGATFSELLEIHTIEFPKLAPLSADDPRSDPSESALERWCRFFVTQSSAELTELTRGNPMIAKANERLLELSADEKMRQRLLEEERRDVAHRLILGAAHDEGRALGLAEGREEGRLAGRREIFGKFVERKFGPLAPALQARIDAASSEELDRWMDRLLDASEPDRVFAS